MLEIFSVNTNLRFRDRFIFRLPLANSWYQRLILNFIISVWIVYILLLDRGQFVEQKLLLSSIFGREKIRNCQSYKFGHTLLCYYSLTQPFSKQIVVLASIQEKYCHLPTEFFIFRLYASSILFKDYVIFYFFKKMYRRFHFRSVYTDILFYLIFPMHLIDRRCVFTNCHR